MPQDKKKSKAPLLDAIAIQANYRMANSRKNPDKTDIGRLIDKQNPWRTALDRWRHFALPVTKKSSF